MMFFLLFALFVYFILIQEKIKSYALKKDDFIAVSIAIPTQKSQNTAAKPKPKPITKKVPLSSSKPKASPTETTEDIDSLFSSVSTQKIVKAKKKPKKLLDQKKLASMQKRVKKVEKSENSKATEKIKDIELKRPVIEIVGQSSSSAEEVNEYLAKIQSDVYDHFQPPSNTQGNTAKIRVWIDSSGSLSDYKILAYSSSDRFNSEVDRLRERLNSLVFPEHPQGVPIVLDIILTAED